MHQANALTRTEHHRLAQSFRQQCTCRLALSTEQNASQARRLDSPAVSHGHLSQAGSCKTTPGCRDIAGKTSRPACDAFCSVDSARRHVHCCQTTWHRIIHELD